MNREVPAPFYEGLGVKFPWSTHHHIRPFAVGRKNWLFSDTVQGADASAILYTLVSTARANQIPVGTYLEWLLKELPLAEARPRTGRLDLTPFMPWAFKARKAAN